jgi:uncharacterized protein DUF6134
MDELAVSTRCKSVRFESMEGSMRRTTCFQFCAAVLALFSIAPSHANPPIPAEGRDFTIFVDGKSVGSFRFTISAQPDGIVTMAGRAHVVVHSLVVFKYEYSYQGSETWKGGVLQRVESATNDGGKKMILSAVCQGDRCQLVANGKQQTVRIPAWTSTYWCLPRPETRGQELLVLDVDTGVLSPARLQFVGKTRLELVGGQRDYSHYRLTGGLQAELWYDEQDRLVRQISMEDGHQTEWRLTGLGPAAPPR